MTAQDPILSGLEERPPGTVVALALSGGVDSAAAAAVLLEQGFQVRLFHLKLTPDQNALPAAEEAASILGLDLRVLDLTAGFEDLIVEPFVRTYARGRTPSPCVSCNPLIKFGLLWKEARRRGADLLATGHYAALGRTADGLRLRRPVDRNKDQTYFLSRLDPEIISRTVFPLAGLTKDQVRRRGRDLGLADRDESQEICFIRESDYRDFLRTKLGDEADRPGDFVDRAGRVLGRHRGLVNYTVGQRRGLGLPGPRPLYVLALDPARGRVVLGHKEETFASELTVSAPVWSAPPPGKGFSALVQIRHRHRPAPAQVTPLEDGRLRVRFEQPQPSPAPGQAAAFYEGDFLMGGGWID